MITFNQVLEVNWVILYFVYGQVFFVMGLVTGLQWRKQSRLELANALPWLSAFGLAHGFTEWGYIFIPLQALYLEDAVVRIMLMVHLALLTLSFFSLLKFGVELLPVFPRHRMLRAVPSVVLLFWVAAFVVRRITVDDPLNVLIAVGDGWSRYFLCFPGSLLAFFGLRHYARRMSKLVGSHISMYMTGAAIAFLVYAVVGGLIVPTAPYFPANLLNYSFMSETVRIPVAIFRSLCGLAMAFFVVRSMEVFQVETDHRIAEMERAQTLAVDRERIGRDLHDGIIQNIFAAGLSLERIQRQDSGDTTRVQRLQVVLDILNRTIQDIRNYIFDLRSSKESNELETVLDGLIRDLRLDTMLEVRLQVVGQRCWDLSPQQTAHLTQIAREALSNVVKHAKAQHVTVSLNYTGEKMCLTVVDDGQGVALTSLTTEQTQGYGIANMRDRTHQLGGTFSMESALDQGVKLSVTVPCESKHDID